MDCQKWLKKAVVSSKATSNGNTSDPTRESKGVDRMLVGNGPCKDPWHVGA